MTWWNFYTNNNINENSSGFGRRVAVTEAGETQGRAGTSGGCASPRCAALPTSRRRRDATPRTLAIANPNIFRLFMPRTIRVRWRGLPPSREERGLRMCSVYRMDVFPFYVICAECEFRLYGCTGSSPYAVVTHFWWLEWTSLWRTVETMTLIYDAIFDKWRFIDMSLLLFHNAPSEISVLLSYHRPHSMRRIHVRWIKHF